MSHRIMTDAETLAIGLAYPTTPQGRIVSAWRHGTLEIVLQRDSVEHLARIFHRNIGRFGWSLLDLNDLIAAIRLAIIIMPAGTQCEPPASPWGKYRLPMEASHFVTENEATLAQAETYPVMTPQEYWETFG